MLISPRLRFLSTLNILSTLSARFCGDNILNMLKMLMVFILGRLSTLFEHLVIGDRLVG